jgi:hypothetical protein
MKRTMMCTLAFAALVAAPAVAVDTTPGYVGSGSTGARATYCDIGVGWEQVPNNINGWANSPCFAGDPNGHLVADGFETYDQYIEGVGWWQIFFAGIPTSPNFVIEIYAVNPSNHCPTGAPLFSGTFTDVTIGPPTGMTYDDRECFADFAANGYDWFLADEGVSYALVVANNNCPGAGQSVFWSTGVGLDSFPSCGKAPGWGYPDWTPSPVALGLYFDQAFYLCGIGIVTPVRETSWTGLKSLYR